MKSLILPILKQLLYTQTKVYSKDYYKILGKRAERNQKRPNLNLDLLNNFVIISKHHRIPLSGGGTDLDFYYKKKGADFSSIAINQYVYVLVLRRNIESNYLIQTTGTQFTNNVNRIKNKLIKETLKFYNIKEKLQINTFSTVPTQTDWEPQFNDYRFN